MKYPEIDETTHIQYQKKTLIKHFITYYKKGMIKVQRYSVFLATGLKKPGNLVMVYTIHLQNKPGKRWEKIALYMEEYSISF